MTLDYWAQKPRNVLLSKIRHICSTPIKLPSKYLLYGIRARENIASCVNFTKDCEANHVVNKTAQFISSQVHAYGFTLGWTAEGLRRKIEGKENFKVASECNIVHEEGDNETFLGILEHKTKCMFNIAPLITGFMIWHTG